MSESPSGSSAGRTARAHGTADGTESTIHANGLAYHVVTWGDGPATVLLCHGFLDIAWSFDALARALLERGDYRVVAFDWRGHGRSEWIGNGGYYHFPDYSLDLDELVPQVGAPLHLVGHSMAGTACTMFAAARPDRIRSLTLIEGLGPPEHLANEPVTRLRSWLDSVARLRQKTLKPMSGVEDALQRMRVQNPELGDELGRFLIERSTIERDGGLLWSFDALHKTLSPVPFRADVFANFLQAVEAPTLVVAGEHGYRLPDEAERMAFLKDHRFVEIPQVGHMIHWFEPGRLADALEGFFRGVSPA